MLADRFLHGRAGCIPVFDEVTIVVLVDFDVFSDDMYCVLVPRFFCVDFSFRCFFFYQFGNVFYVDFFCGFDTIGFGDFTHLVGLMFCIFVFSIVHMTR